MAGNRRLGPKAASVTPNSASKTYGDADPALTGTLNGFLSSDAVTATYNRAGGETVGGSPYVIKAALSPAGVLGNYSITYNTAPFTITPKSASVTPAGTGKTYGSNDPALTGVMAGFLSSDNVTALFSRAVGENAGTYSITAALAPAGVLSNYHITYNTASFVIAPLAASVTPNAAGKTFGDSDPAPLTSGSVTGFLAADSVPAAYKRNAGETPGQYTINATLSPASVLSNYSITYNTANFAINKYSFSTCDANGHCISGSKPNDNGIGGRLTITSTAPYGGNATATVTLSPATVNTRDGLTSPGMDNNGQPLPPVFKVWLAPAGDPAPPVLFGAGTATKAGPDASGNYAWQTSITAALDESSITPGNYTAYVYGDDGSSLTNNQVQSDAGYGNPDLTDFIYSTLTARLTVTQAPTTTSVQAPAVTYNGGGIVTVTVTSAAGTPTGNVSLMVDGTSVTSALNSGSAVFTINGLNAGDHSLTAAYAPQVNFAASSSTGTLRINPRLITVTADTKSKTYGATDPTLTYQITNGALVNGDGFTGSLTRDAGEAAGAYTIRQGTLTLSSNYSLTYVPATFTIAKKAASVTPGPVTKVYGDADPTLSGTLDGFLSSDSVTASYSRSAGETVAGSPYAIAATLTPAGVLANYDIMYNTAGFTIAPRPATVTAGSGTKVYGTTDPALNTTQSGFTAADAPTIPLNTTRAAGESVRSYSTTPAASGAVLGNYTVKYVSGSFDITVRPVTITADAKTKVYGAPDPPLTYQITSGSLIGTDTFTGNINRVAGENAGTYAIQQGTLSLSSNYALTFAGADFVITRATPVITWNNPAPIEYATPLTSVQLNATASVAGTFTYSLPAGTVLPLGAGPAKFTPYPLSASFTPADTNNFNAPAPKSVTIVVQDTIPPVTTARPSPAPNAAGWNNANVTVALSAVETPFIGSGVRNITVTLSGAMTGTSITNGATASVTIATSGTTTLTYFANDYVGNTETSKTLVVKVDKLPPELFNQFDPVIKRVQVFATDVASAVPSAPLAGVCSPIKWNRDNEGKSDDGKGGDKSENGNDDDKNQDLSCTYTFTDVAGNATKLVEEIKHDGASDDDSHSTQVVVVSFQYGNGPVIKAPVNSKKFEWAVDKDGSLKTLHQNMTIGSGGSKREVQAMYDSKKNETTITDKPGEDDDDRGRGEKKIVKPGLVLLKLGTSNGKLVINY